MSQRIINKFMVLLFAFILALSVTVKNAGAVEFGVEGDYWMTSLSGTIKSDLGGVTGDSIDFKEDLGMKDENSPGGKFYFQIGKHRLSLNSASLRYEGSKNITNSIDFHGQTYSAATSVTSKMELRQTNIQYTYWLLNMKTGLRLGLVGAVKSVSAKASLTATGIDEEESISAVLPMAGVSGEIGLGDLVRLKATGTAGSSLSDVTAALEISPVPLFGISLGYRSVHLGVNANGMEIKMDTTGAFVGLFAHF